MNNTSNKPSWDLHQPYCRAVSHLLGCYRAADRTTEDFLSSVLLVEDASVLLSGIFGTGKTQLVHLIRKIFFSEKNATGHDFGDVTCHQEQTPFEVNFHLDLGKYSQGEEVVHPRAIVTSRLKFVNEIQRASPSVCNGLLSLLSEKFVLHRDQRIESPSYLCFLDRNPVDSGSSEIPGAFMDRIDYSVTLSRPRTRDLMKIQEQMENSGGDFARKLSELDIREHFCAEDMEELWRDVSRVELQVREQALITLTASYFQACIYTDRSLVSPEHKLPCSTCTYRAEVCSKLKTIPGVRFVMSTIRLAKAHAWLRRSPIVEPEDIFWCLPFVLSHRVMLQADVEQAVINIEDWVKQVCYGDLIQPKLKRWQQAIHIKEQYPERLHELESFAKQDLALREYLS